MEYDIAIDFGATQGRITPRLNGTVRPDLAWQTDNAGYQGPLAVVDAFRGRRVFQRSELATARLTAVGVGWPGYVNPVLSAVNMTNPPQWAIERSAFESSTGARLVLVHDGAAHLASIIKPEHEGGATVQRDIFGVGDGLEGAGLTLDFPGTGLACGAVIYDEHGRLVLKTSEASHGGMRMPVQGMPSEEDFHFLWTLYQMAEEGLFEGHSPSGCVSPDVLLSSKGLRLLAIAAGRMLGEEVDPDIRPEDVTTEEVTSAIVRREQSDDPRVKALRKWLGEHGTHANGLIVADNAYRGLILGGLFATLGVDVIAASEFLPRLHVGQHADKVRQTPIHLLVDPESGQKGVFAAIDLAV